MNEVPMILATWSFGAKANEAGWKALIERDDALDAAVVGCTEIEEDPENLTVGYSAYPDAGGRISLDASVMESASRSAGVCFVRRYLHVTKIARQVMESTRHKLLAGDGAEAFAQAQGFEERELNTDVSRQSWEKWKASHEHDWRGLANIEEANMIGGDPESLPHNRYHDTVGVLAVNSAGKLAGACSTSGLAFKMPGRVGDSPNIGQGLYVHPEYGAAVGTGTGELIMGVCGTFLAVELMRNGVEPAEAARQVVLRIAESYEIAPEHQAAIIALRPDGQWGSAALRPGFTAACRSKQRTEQCAPGYVHLTEPRKRETDD